MLKVYGQCGNSYYMIQTLDNGGSTLSSSGKTDIQTQKYTQYSFMQHIFIKRPLASITVIFPSGAKTAQWTKLIISQVWHAQIAR